MRRRRTPAASFQWIEHGRRSIVYAISAPDCANPRAEQPSHFAAAAARTERPRAGKDVLGTVEGAGKPSTIVKTSTAYQPARNDENAQCDVAWESRGDPPRCIGKQSVTRKGGCYIPTGRSRDAWVGPGRCRGGCLGGTVPDLSNEARASTVAGMGALLHSRCGERGMPAVYVAWSCSAHTSRPGYVCLSLCHLRRYSHVCCLSDCTAEELACHDAAANPPWPGDPCMSCLQLVVPDANGPTPMCGAYYEPAGGEPQACVAHGQQLAGGQTSSAWNCTTPTGGVVSALWSLLSLFNLHV